MPYRPPLLQGAALSQVHSTHILCIGSNQLGIVDKKVCVDEVEIDIVDELGRGGEVGEVPLDVDVRDLSLPELQHLSDIVQIDTCVS